MAQLRKLGPDGPSVYPIGYGGMPISVDPQPSSEQGVAVVHAALDAGVTFIDTANVYCLDDNDIGHNERVIAKALATWSGDASQITVATKGGLTRPEGRWERNGDPAFIKTCCEASLKALGTDCIDLYQFHAPDPEVPFAESMGAFAELKEAGKVKQVGLSNVSVEQIEVAQKVVPVASVQNKYSPYFTDSDENGVLSFCTRHHIAFLPWNPVGGRRLAKDIDKNAVLSGLCQKYEATPWQLLLAWHLAKWPTSIPIPGSANPDHAAANVKAGDIDLDLGDVDKIDKATWEDPQA